MRLAWNCTGSIGWCGRRALEIYLIDGTYELFRHYYAVPSAKDEAGREVGAVRGVLASLLGMLKSGTTHIGVATDHVIESFRNDLWPGYKTGEGVEPELLAQFPLLEEVLVAAGIVVWPMVEFEADDALAAAAIAAAKDSRVERVIICTPADISSTSGTRPPKRRCPSLRVAVELGESRPMARRISRRSDSESSTVEARRRRGGRASGGSTAGMVAHWPDHGTPRAPTRR